MRRTKEEAMETRRLILESALNVFSSKNYANATLTEIAENVGLSKGALYWHFKNKNDLLLQLVEMLCRESEKNLQSAIDSPDESKKLCNYYKSELRRPIEDERYQKIHLMMQNKNEWPKEIRERVHELVSESLDRDKKMVEMLIISGQKKGTIKRSISASEVAVLISCIFHGLCAMQLAGLLPKEFPDYTDILFTAMSKEMQTDGHESEPVPEKENNIA